MKELTTEQKAKRYDEAIKRAEKWRNAPNIDKIPTFANRVIDEIFPEFEENEDEKIRKEIINFLELPHPQFVGKRDHKTWIAWLEKQGEHANFRNKIQIGDKVTRNEGGVLVNISQLNRVAKERKKQGEQKIDDDDKAILENWESIVKDNKEKWQLSDWFVEATLLLVQKIKQIGLSKSIVDNNKTMLNACINTLRNVGHSHLAAWLEKQSEKPQGKLALEAAKEEKVDNADKIEPKFKVGNWYQCTKDFFGKGVTFDKNTAYYCAKEGCLQNKYGCHVAIVKNLYDNFKLWTIQDAKDGDVLEFGDHGRLVVGIVSYVNKITGNVDVNCLLENNNFKVGNYYNLDTIKPHPATKEQRDLLLQKMKEAGYEWDAEKKELKKIEQKPAWSEEDNFMYNKIKNLLTDISLAPESIKSLFDWLKDLRDRVQPQTTWKPSEEMLEALDIAIRSGIQLGSWEEKTLRELQKQLKAL